MPVLMEYHDQNRKRIKAGMVPAVFVYRNRQQLLVVNVSIQQVRHFFRTLPAAVQHPVGHQKHKSACLIDDPVVHGGGVTFDFVHLGKKHFAKLLKCSRATAHSWGVFSIL